ncbi:SRPBCC family protein [Streptomyces parvulus]|uniref:SRPBCC family protein n=1 Tax=Streptomyces parvulus TaxID=146923 RepID=UPI0033342BE6
MPSLHFHMDSSMTPDEVMGVLTDFTPARVERWPSIDAEHFQVHDRGDSWAEITEGNDKTWENARYEWDPSHNRVTVTTHDSTPFGPGGWDFRLTPTDAGTRIDVSLERHPSSLKAKLLSPVIPLAGPMFRKSFREPLKAT